MNLWQILGSALLVVAIVLDAQAFRQIKGAFELSRPQKIMQFVFVLSLPIIGALIVNHLLTEDALTENVKSNPDRNDNENYLSSGSTNQRRDHVRNSDEGNALDSSGGSAD